MIVEERVFKEMHCAFGVESSEIHDGPQFLEELIPQLVPSWVSSVFCMHRIYPCYREFICSQQLHSSGICFIFEPWTWFDIFQEASVSSRRELDVFLVDGVAGKCYSIFFSWSSQKSEAQICCTNCWRLAKSWWKYEQLRPDHCLPGWDGVPTYQVIESITCSCSHIHWMNAKCKNPIK